MRPSRFKRLKVQRDLDVMRAMCSDSGLLTSECESIPWTLPTGPPRRWDRGEPEPPEDKASGPATPRREQDGQG